MNRYFKILHFAGMIMFLGSIFTYIVISSLAGKEGLAELVFAREIIKTGTNFLTIPGLWLTIISGIVMAGTKYSLFGHRWLYIKLFLSLLIVLNTYFIIGPAINGALAASKDSLAANEISEAFHAAYMRESVAGAFNVIFAVIAIIAGIWKLKGRKCAED
ncbi:MAG: hypothetical protein HY954_10080 [Deltaproteobacteria bacterium]|nr:hypothetical protein [Deltaproteobacteria bacterium]